MPIAWDSQGRITVSSSWFIVDPERGGKVQATPEGRIFGYLFESGTPLAAGPLAGQTLDARKVDTSAWAQGLITTEDGERFAVGHLSYGPAHYANPMEMVAPDKAVIVATATPTDRGLYIAGSVHPDALRHHTLGEVVGRINSMPWSIEEDPDSAPVLGQRRDYSRSGLKMRRDAGAVSVLQPGFPLASLAAGAVDEQGESVDLATVIREATAQGVALGIERERERHAADEQRRALAASVAELPVITTL